jgi:hypothetical protein
MSKLDDLSALAFSAGYALVPYPTASELRIVVQCGTLGNQQERLLKELDAAIERFVARAEIDAKVVSE